MLRNIVAAVLDYTLQQNQHLGTIGACSFSRDGGLAVTVGFDGCAKLLDTASNRRLWRFRDRRCPFRSVAFVRDDSEILCASFTGDIYRIATNTGRILQHIRIPYSMQSAAIFRDGRRVIVGHKHLYLWDIDASKKIHRFATCEKIPTFICLSKNEKSFLTAQIAEHDVGFWGVERGKLVSNIKCKSSCWAISVAPDATWFAAVDGNESRVHKYSLPDGTDLGVLQDVRDAVLSVSISPSGKYLAVSYHDGGVGFVDLESSKEIYRSDIPVECAGVLVFSPDDRQVITGTASGNINLIRRR